jgi:hypothetical protein
MVRNHLHAAASLILAVAATTPAAAAVSSGGFVVSVRVVARTSIEPVDEPASILLTAADLEQGYKILDLRYRVHTAGTSQYLLNIAPRTGLTDRIHIDGLGAPVELGDTDIAVLQQVSANVSELRLRLRLELRSGLAAGPYPLPVRLSVSAS